MATDTRRQPAPPTPGAATAWRPTVGILTKRDGHEQVLGFEAPTPSELLPVRAEVWLHGMRANVLGTDLEAHQMSLAPGKTEGDRLRNYRVQLIEGDRSFQKSFSVYSLSNTARRGTARLLKQKTLQAEDNVYYFLAAEPPADAGRGPAEAAAEPVPAQPGIRVRNRSPTLILDEAPLEEFMQSSRPLEQSWAGPVLTPDQDSQLHLPAFVFPEVWEAGHQCSRRGEDLESAGMWAGRLLRDVESRSLFMVIDACIDARHAAIEKKYSVELSGDTWGKVRDVLQQRRKRLNRPHEILLGSIHGHNFLPGAEEDGKPSCAECPSVAECKQSTAAASTFDIDWHRSVFSWGQPWAILGVWGYNARGEEHWQLYGQADGSLMPRSIRLLEDPKLR